MQQLAISYPFSLPSKKKEEEKENEVTKPVLNHFLKFTEFFRCLITI